MKTTTFALLAALLVAVASVDGLNLRYTEDVAQGLKPDSGAASSDSVWYFKAKSFDAEPKTEDSVTASGALEKTEKQEMAGLNHEKLAASYVAKTTEKVEMMDGTAATPLNAAAKYKAAAVDPGGNNALAAAVAELQDIKDDLKDAKVEQKKAAPAKPDHGSLPPVEPTVLKEPLGEKAGHSGTLEMTGLNGGKAVAATEEAGYVEPLVLKEPLENKAEKLEMMGGTAGSTAVEAAAAAAAEKATDPEGLGKAPPALPFLAGDKAEKQEIEMAGLKDRHKLAEVNLSGYEAGAAAALEKKVEKHSFSGAINVKRAG